jgi:hypothetical protein
MTTWAAIPSTDRQVRWAMLFILVLTLSCGRAYGQSPHYVYCRAKLPHVSDASAKFESCILDYEKNGPTDKNYGGMSLAKTWTSDIMQIKIRMAGTTWNYDSPKLALYKVCMLDAQLQQLKQPSKLGPKTTAECDRAINQVEYESELAAKELAK